MDCRRCGAEASAEARFCGECGASLTATVGCPGCAAENPAGQRFCSSCGHSLIATDAHAASAGSGDGRANGRDPREYTPAHLADKILGARADFDGERKQVTVLFADVIGSMQLSEETDPETWRAIMERFFAILCDGVHRFEGTVDKFTGDGIMALFGAPLAHEDHAQRACWAALALQRELSLYSAQDAVAIGLARASHFALPWSYRMLAETLLAAGGDGSVVAAGEALDRATAAVQATGTRGELPLIERAREKLIPVG